LCYLNSSNFGCFSGLHDVFLDPKAELTLLERMPNSAYRVLSCQKSMTYFLSDHAEAIVIDPLPDNTMQLRRLARAIFALIIFI
jgi:hypothetical protein